MRPRAIFGIVGLIAVAVVLVALVGHDDSYRLRVPLQNASGLKSGSPVIVAGVPRGTVQLHLEGDDVVAELKLDKRVAPVGRDARVAVTAANFLGQKRVELDPGRAAQAAPSGFTVPSAHVTTPTDLDQVLDVLDGDTRARVTVLLDEAGQAVLGRRADIGQVLKEFPLGIQDATRVLNQVNTDDRIIRDLLVRSDRFVAEVTTKRSALDRLVNEVGQTAKSVAGRRADLRATLARAPGALASLRGFLGDLQQTTVPLGPAAREISASAPALGATLAQVKPFTQTATPTLRQAQAVAPRLTRLADGATPVLRRARPALAALASLAQALPPLSTAVGRSSNNILAVLENWSRAIQFRDGLSHVFRGEASVTPNLLLAMLNRLGPPAGARNGGATHGEATRPASAAAPAAPASAPADPVARVPGLAKVKVPAAVDQILQQLLPGVPATGAAQPAPGGDGAQKLLDFLLKP
jgi:phospholipid/cholesterol/gamma-HCH transport system substrate-binding protein